MFADLKRFSPTVARNVYDWNFAYNFFINSVPAIRDLMEGKESSTFIKSFLNWTSPNWSILPVTNFSDEMRFHYIFYFAFLVLSSEILVHNKLARWYTENSICLKQPNYLFKANKCLFTSVLHSEPISVNLPNISFSWALV